MLEEVTSQNKIVQKICVISVLLFITIVFIWSRNQIIQSHFAHYDDLYIGYAFSIIDNYSPTFFKDQLTKYGGGIGMIIGDKTFDLFSEFPNIFTIFKRFLAPFAISKMSTYAPMQYFISAITVDLDTSYARSIITTRLSSTIFSITKGKFKFKRKLTFDDLKIADNYNTYYIKGLPPSPICFVGMKTIEIVLENYKSDYLFYFFDENLNKHIFSKTFENHKNKLKKYRLNDEK